MSGTTLPCRETLHCHYVASVFHIQRDDCCILAAGSWVDTTAHTGSAAMRPHSDIVVALAVKYVVNITAVRPIQSPSPAKPIAMRVCAGFRVSTIGISKKSE